MASENQFLFHALYMGVFITFIYDILRILRKVFPHGKWAVSMEDLLFWIYCAAKVFLLMHHESNGTLRWFAVLGALTGMLLYLKLFSPFLIKWVSLVLQKIVDFLVKIGSILFRPLKVAGKAVTNTAKSTGMRINERKGRIRQRVKKKLTFLLKMLKMNL